MDGFLNLNKPFGLTSHDCVARVRRLLRLKRVGHGGTLDPAATGVLPIAIGRATRLLQFLPHDKAYRASIRLGWRTTTDDLQGDLLETRPVADLTIDRIQAELSQFEGTIQQIPPRYSAIQVGGKRLYDLARAGEAVDVPARTVQVYRIDLLDWRPPKSSPDQPDYAELDVAIACGAGTYIRSIARDLGETLQTGGTLAALTRTHSSGFDLIDSLTLETLEQQLQSGEFQPTPPAIALPHLPYLTLSADLIKRWQQGQRLRLEAEMRSSELADRDDRDSYRDSFCQLQQPDGAFLGIGQLILLEQEQWVVPKLVWN